MNADYNFETIFGIKTNEKSQTLFKHDIQVELYDRF